MEVCISLDLLDGTATKPVCFIDEESSVTFEDHVCEKNIDGATLLDVCHDMESYTSRAFPHTLSPWEIIVSCNSGACISK
jgi:hypothetical protein